MKKIIYLFTLLFPLIINAQTVIKIGGGVANRWNETLNIQTVGKGFRFSAEKFIKSNLSTGLTISSFVFNPTPSVEIKYISVNFNYTYYFYKKTLKPYSGIGIGYNRFFDRTTIDLGNNISSKQDRTKNYGVISPFVGIKFTKKEKKLGLFFQINADFVPISKIAPIGFISTTLGFSSQL